ncbi:MAG: hypothetical protein ABIW82_19015 [Dokdonella sp.]
MLMFLRYGFVLFASILSSAAAHAAIYTVGADSACNFTGIGAAAAAAEANPGADTIHVASPDVADPNAPYTNQAIVFTASEELDIVGGFANCSQAASTGSHTIIDGAGGITDPVLRITVNTGGLVKLSYLTIQHGDEDGSGKGGGIYFTGNGILELNHATVTQNTAGSGGGIYAQGTGADTELVIGEDVTIVGNTARIDGGGIVNDGTEMTMTQPDSYIASNHAPNGYGGGLLVKADVRDAYTYLGSSGFGNLGPVYLNDARQGGGVAVLGSNQRAELKLFTTDLARPVRIKGNTASVEGGGIYLGPAAATRVLSAWGVWIEDNIAPHSAAIHTGQIYFNDPANRPLGAIDCPIRAPCGGIVRNAAIDGASQPVGGIVEITHNESVFFNRMTFEGNIGKYLFYGDGPSFFSMHNVAITDNTASGSLIVAENGSNALRFKNTTIAGNAIGDNTVLRLGNGGQGTLHRTIIWQPGKTTVHLNGDPLDLLDDMVSERDSVDGGNSPNVTVLDPRFVDPEHGDYSLRAASPAVDYSAVVPGDAADLNSNPRDADLPIVQNVHGPRDLGAIERPLLQPLVLNSDFDADLRLWNTAIAGIATLDTTRNVTGAAGSGSVHISSPANAVPGTRFGALVQCVHLPGPGVYSLNGWGHGTGTMVTAGDIAELYWEYRKNGAEGCTVGAPNASGTKILSSGNSWSRPASPALITVSAQDWTSMSSIAVTLVAEENGASGAPTNAWFDGITLNVGGDDAIFANGFDGM